MLTTAYYYSIYQPFIMQRQSIFNRENRVSYARLAQNAQSLMNTEAKITKNTQVKQSVKSYVDAICRRVTDMRDSSKYLAQNIENYYINVLNESLETSKQWVEEDISMFVNAYNNAVIFGAEQEHSPELARYATDLRNLAVNYEQSLNAAGVTVLRDSGLMGFTPERIQGMNLLEFGHNTALAAKAAKSMYDRTAELLRLPAQAHMDFNQLSYYYNYRIDHSAEEAMRKTPTLLYAGMLLNKVI